MIKAITFDYWNTLYADRNFEERLEKRIDYFWEKLRVLGKKRTKLEIQLAFERAGSKWLNLWEKESKSFTPREIVGLVLKNLNLDLPEDRISEFTIETGELTLKVPPVLIEGAKDFLKKISSKYSLGIISDTGATPGSVLKKIMEKDGIAKYFRSFVFSDEILSTKPDPKNFMKALEPLGVGPDEAVHIGDIERTDIQGAKDLGMKAILFTKVNGNGEKGSKADLVVNSYLGLDEKLKNL
jgi:putative hydrolase of the HAD superfamily